MWRWLVDGSGSDRGLDFEWVNGVSHLVLFRERDSFLVNVEAKIFAIIVKIVLLRCS